MTLFRPPIQPNTAFISSTCDWYTEKSFRYDLQIHHHSNESSQYRLYLPLPGKCPLSSISSSYRPGLRLLSSINPYQDRPMAVVVLLVSIHYRTGNGCCRSVIQIKSFIFILSSAQQHKYKLHVLLRKHVIIR